MLKKICLLVACTVSAFAIHNAELNINNTDLEVNVRFDVGQFRDRVEPNTMFIGGRYFKPDKTAVYKGTNDILEPYYEVNMLIRREIGSRGMTLGMGVKVNHTKDFSSSPLGMEFSYKLPVSSLFPMHISSSVYYAPQVLSYKDAKNFLDYKASLDVELIENASVTIGYRSIKTTYVEKFNTKSLGSFNYNSSLYFGFKLDF